MPHGFVSPARAETPASRIRELFAYAIATGVAVMFDFALLNLLVSGAGIHYAIAAALSFICASMLLYALCTRFVFAARRQMNRTLELSVFIVLGIAGLLIQTAVMLIAVGLLSTHYLVAKLVAACCTFLANFLLRRKLLFSRTAPSRDDA